MYGKEGRIMLSVALVLLGLFLMCAQSKIVVLIGIGLLAAGAYFEDAYCEVSRSIKRKKSCHRPK